MRNLKYISIVLLAFVLASCEKEYTEVHRVTYYPEFTVEGDATITIKKGDTFDDPGATAQEDGTELAVATTVTSLLGATEFDANKVDIYTFTYSAENSDGYAGSATRTVIVGGSGDLSTSIEGIYISDTGRSSEQFTGLKWVVISETEPNKYKLSHALGGYYSIGRAYGEPYSFVGSVITKEASGYTATMATAPAWGNTTELSAITVDATAKTVSFLSAADFGSDFTVVLTLDPDLN